jgi:DNA ligase-associated metallophosphoesterase
VAEAQAGGLPAPPVGTFAEHWAGGQRLQLLPERAAYLPAQATLLVADAHLGKAQTFRRLGVPVPAGTTAEGLQRLGALVQATGARRIVFLGDLLHAAWGRSPALEQAFAAWRLQHAALELLLVRGNHDRHAGDPPAAWGVACVEEPWRLAALPGQTSDPAAGGLALAHHPQPCPGAYVLAGHVHPAVVLGGRARQRLRLPCFHFGPQVGLLPAFGGFTGSHVLNPGPGDRVYAIAGEVVRAVA